MVTISVCSWHFTLSYRYATKRHKVLTNKQLLRLSFHVLSTIDVHKQDAKAQRCQEATDMRGGVEGIGFREHGNLHPVSLQDRPQVFR